MVVLHFFCYNTFFIIFLKILVNFEEDQQVDCFTRGEPGRLYFDTELQKLHRLLDREVAKLAAEKHKNK